MMLKAQTAQQSNGKAKKGKAAQKQLGFPEAPI
jgi:hypothetical protein